MGSLATINIVFNANTKSFYKSTDKITSKLEKVGKKLQGIGAKMTLFSAPLLKLGYDGLRAWDVQVKAIAQVEQGLKTTGGTVGFVSKQLQQMASDLQNNSLFGDEEILKGVTAQLLTFTNIAGDEFKRTQQAALDLATRLDGDLKSASIQLGKALNDPVKNLSALSRSGIQFTAQQKLLIKQLWETGRAADAQKVILTELEKQYGGSAAAAAAAGLGPLKQLQNSFGDLTEEIGAVIAEAFIPLVNVMKKVVAWFQNLNPEVKRWIVIVGGVVTAIGPLLLFVGVTLPAMSAGIGAVGAAFTALTGPIGLVVAAIVGLTVLIIKNWEKVKGWIVDIVDGFIDLYNESITFKTVVETIIFLFKWLYEIASFALNGVWEILKSLARQIENTFTAIGEFLTGVFTGDLDRVAKSIKDFAKNTSNEMNTLGRSITNELSDLWDNVNRHADVAVGRIKFNYQIDKEGFKQDISDAWNDVNEYAANLIKGTTPLFSPGEGFEGSVSIPGEGREGIEPAMQDLPMAGIMGPLLSFPERLKETQPAMVEALSEWEITMIDFNLAASDLMNQFAENMVVGFAESLGAVATGGMSLKGMLSNILQMFADFVVEYGKLVIKFAMAQIAIKNSFKNPGLALAAGVALVAIGTAMKNLLGGLFGGGNKPPALANGGIAYGRTLAEIGEYSGARSNPEVIAPLDKLKKLIQPSDGFSGSVRFEIEGDKLVGILDREQSLRSDLV